MSQLPCCAGASLLAGFVLIASSCSSGGDDPLVTLPPSEPAAPAQILSLGDPIVNAPGRVTQWVRASGSTPGATGLAPFGGLQSSDVLVQVDGQLLPAEDVQVGAPLPARAAVAYLLLDRIPEQAGLTAEQLGELAAEALAGWTGAGGVHLAVGWIDGTGLLNPAIATPGGGPFQAFVAPEALPLYISALPDALAEGSAPYDAMATAAANLNEFVDNDPALRFVEQVDRFMLVVNAGGANTGALGPLQMLEVLEGISTTVFSFGPPAQGQDGVALGFTNATAEDIDELSEGLASEVEAQRRRVEAAHRVSFLAPATDPTGTRSAILYIDPDGDGEPGGGLHSNSDRVDFTFSDDGFAPGAALLDRGLLSGLGSTGEFLDAQVLEDGRSWVLASAPEIAGRLFGLDANGAKDPGLGIGGQLNLNLQQPPGVIGLGWEPSPVGLAATADGADLFVAVNWQAPGTHRVALYRFDTLGNTGALLLPSASETGSDFATGVQLDPLGRVMVFGVTGPLATQANSSFLMRVVSNLEGGLGTPLFVDPSFGDSGVVRSLSDQPNVVRTAWDLAMSEPDSTFGLNYWLMGEQQLSATSPFDLRIDQFRSDGSTEYAFGPGGSALGSSWRSAELADLSTTGRAIELDVDGVLRVAGTIHHPQSGYPVPALWRVDRFGFPDLNFVGDEQNVFSPLGLNSSPGLVGLAFEAGSTGEGLFDSGVFVEDLAIGPDGSWLLAGARLSKTRLDATWWRFAADGTLDTKFNDLGWTLENGTLPGDFDETIRRVGIAPDGTLLSFGGSAVSLTTGEPSTLAPIHFVDADPKRAYTDQ